MQLSQQKCTVHAYIVLQICTITCKWLLNTSNITSVSHKFTHLHLKEEMYSHHDSFVSESGRGDEQNVERSTQLKPLHTHVRNKQKFCGHTKRLALDLFIVPADVSTDKVVNDSTCAEWMYA